MRHNIFSAPAGPSVVMMCITLIMFVPVLRSESSPMLTSQFFFGRNRRPSEQAPHIPRLGMSQQILVHILVGVDHVCHVVILPCTACGGGPHKLPRRFIFEERVHRLCEPLTISWPHQESFIARLKPFLDATYRAASHPHGH